MHPINVSGLIQTSPDPYGVRNMGRVKIRVEVAPTNGIECVGQHWKRGISEHVVYADQLNEVQRMVQDDEDRQILEQAKRAYEVQLAAYLREHKGRDASQYGGSVWAEFNRIAGRGIRPIVSLEVLEAVAPPDTPESRADRQTDRLAEALERAVEKIADRMAQERKGRKNAE